jgi:dipeptidyl aminopeptidase/acylaminoacyl peptidase
MSRPGFAFCGDTPGCWRTGGVLVERLRPSIPASPPKRADRVKGWKQTRHVPPQSDPATDVWLLSTSGGPAIPLAGPKKPYGRVFNDGFYGRLSFSRDGKKLAFVADDGTDPRTAEEISNEVLVVRPDQGEGYTGYGPAQVWVAHMDEKPDHHAATRIERLMKDDVWYGDPQWSPDARTLVVHANRTAERESVRYSINRNFDVMTPTPILHSRDDRRCPLPMGLAFHQALRARGVPTQMVIYPDEGHGIRQPRHREDVLRRLIAWFAKYDKK